ncbi:FtsX-like permease family protein [Streptomyces pathocidini]|uniref:ABC transporter permease n=1 Tax=Streptomyces pathocidini TaxID=1650571 RepID=UPI0033DCCF33
MSAPKTWIRDLGMGTRFALSGGREGWTRTLLTAVGVGLGVALLLLTTAIPSALANRDARGEARADITYSGGPVPKADDTVLVMPTDDRYRQEDVRGRIMRPEGPKAPLPPGVSRFPGAGEMVVSPALKKLLGSDEGALLRERRDQRIVGTISDAGLIGPSELTYIAGSDTLRLGDGPTQRIDHYGTTGKPAPRMDPVLLLLTLIVFIVLLMPVAVFIATAVRFGGERRDRRLAALRLIGADGRTTRRIAAGEALAGSLLGLAVGAVVFLLGRQWAGNVEVLQMSVFPHDLNPSPVLALLILVAVPAAAVGVTLFALRGVVIEPLGVVRTAKPARRRLWWRLLMPLAGLGLLYPMIGQGRSRGDFNQAMVIGGVALLLVGVTALLPWLVEAVVARLGAGPVSWQLAVRRMQLTSGAAARLVNGIAVAVAGAIALHMLFTGVESDYTRATDNDLSRAQMAVSAPTSPESSAQISALARQLAHTDGVARVTPPVSSTYAGDTRRDPGKTMAVHVGTCAALRAIAELPSCRDGDVFAVRDAPTDVYTAQLAKAGRTVHLDPGFGSSKGAEVPWRLPEGIRKAQPRKDPTGNITGGLLVTPKAFPAGAALATHSEVFVKLDESVPDAREYVRNAAAKASPLAQVQTLAASEQSRRFASIRTGLLVGAACVMLLIGASLLVSQLEQLRERRKLLSALLAFGTRRSTLSLSVLWQTAVPITLGLTLATAVGLGLGAVLQKMAGASMTVDAVAVATMAGIGAAVVLLVTLLALPALWRLMRPDGLRTE